MSQPSAHPPNHLSLNSFVPLLICQSIHLPTYPFFSSSIHSPTHLSIHPSIHSSIHPSVHLSFFIHPSIHQSIHLPFIHLCIPHPCIVYPLMHLFIQMFPFFIIYSINFLSHLLPLEILLAYDPNLPIKISLPPTESTNSKLSWAFPLYRKPRGGVRAHLTEEEAEEEGGQPPTLSLSFSSPAKPRLVTLEQARCPKATSQSFIHSFK